MSAEITYPIAPGPTPTPAGFVTGPGLSPAIFRDILGFGLVTPFRRGPNDFVNGGGIAFVQSMVSQVLGVRCDSDFTTGELPWRTEFGSLAHFLRHKANSPALQDLGRVYIADAIAVWVPQIRLKDVELEKKAGPQGEKIKNVLAIRLLYDIIGVNRPGNQVLIPNVSQDVLLSLTA